MEHGQKEGNLMKTEHTYYGLIIQYYNHERMTK